MKRRESLWINMRNFHNNIKNDLIKETVDSLKKEKITNLSLVDVSVGRGGDLYKWYKNGINIVFGTDINEDSIKEARYRFSNDYKFKRKNYIFEVKDITKIDYKIPQGLTQYYHIVSCQFSFHYFTKTQQIMETVLKNISNLLIPGGYFIGTAPFKIKEILTSKNDFIIKDNNLIIAEILKTNNENEYTFKLTDIDDSGNYFKEVENLPEYFIDKENFIKTCENNGLKLIYFKNFEKYKNPYLKPYEKSISFLNESFIFKKQIYL